MIAAFVFGTCFGIFIDQANTRGWLKTAFDWSVAQYKAWRAKP